MSDSESPRRSRLQARPVWQLFDENYRAHRSQYIKQTLMATATMLVVLLLLDLI